MTYNGLSKISVSHVVFFFFKVSKMRSKILLLRPPTDEPTPLLWRHSVPKFFLPKTDCWKRLSDPGFVFFLTVFQLEVLWS